MKAPLTIGQLARAAGSTAKTIRYYEEVGVLPAAPRNSAGYRQYSRADVGQLLFVRRARALGLSLTDLKALVGDLQAEKCAAMRPRLRVLVAEQLRIVQQRIGELQSLERQLAEINLRLMTTDSPSPQTNGCGCLGRGPASSAQR
jgi:DNA-binding transcriptional MerR regulator